MTTKKKVLLFIGWGMFLGWIGIIIAWSMVNKSNKLMEMIEAADRGEPLPPKVSAKINTLLILNTIGKT